MLPDNEIIDQILEHIEEIDYTHVIEIVGRVCEKLEIFHCLPGEDKKRLAILALKTVMDDSDLSKQEIVVIMKMLPYMIDDLVYMTGEGSKEFRKKKTCCCQKPKDCEKKSKKSVKSKEKAVKA